MIPNNNFSVLPWYRSVNEQNARKWWVYNRVYPLYVQAGYMPPFQFLRTHSSVKTVYNFRLRKADGTLVGTFTQNIVDGGIDFKYYAQFNLDAVIFGGQSPIFPALENGQYYAEINVVGGWWYSEIFTVVNDIEPYLKLEWWDVDDFVMDAGAIAYKYSNNTQFKNVLYLPSDIAKPEYIFEEEGESRDGYFFPAKQISEKRYRFNFFAPEYLLDVLRFVRMADFAQITYHGQIYSLDTFLMTPTWEDNGDVAVVEAEFDTATVAKKLGVGYIKALRGDFNDDFNNDYNNQ
jgi:hypothetical protein